MYKLEGSAMSTKEIEVIDVQYYKSEHDNQPKRKPARPLTFSNLEKAGKHGNDMFDYFLKHGKFPVSK